MDLLDGLDRYKHDAKYWHLTLSIERSAQQVCATVSRHDNQPTSEALHDAMELLKCIESWKALCLQSRTGNAIRNPERVVWSALRGVFNAQSDVEAIRSVMQLKGFGSSSDEETGQRRAKAATAVLRFLMPEDWGVVDWRTVAMLSCLDKGKGDVDTAMKLAKREKAAELRDLFDIIDEHQACEVNLRYRGMRLAAPLARAADIDMALFGLSLIAWPI